VEVAHATAGNFRKRGHSEHRLFCLALHSTDSELVQGLDYISQAPGLELYTQVQWSTEGAPSRGAQSTAHANEHTLTAHVATQRGQESQAQSRQTSSAWLDCPSHPKGGWQGLHEEAQSAQAGAASREAVGANGKLEPGPQHLHVAGAQTQSDHRQNGRSASRQAREPRP